MSWQAHRAIEYGREVVGQTRDELAEGLTKVTGDAWSYQMVAKLESGRKTFTVDLLQAVAEVQGLPYEWYLVDPRSKLGGFRGSNEDTPGYDRFAPADTRHEAYLLNSGLARVDHRIGDCINCLLDPDFHVAAEWTDIPGQLVIDLRDEALERWLQGAA